MEKALRACMYLLGHTCPEQESVGKDKKFVVSGETTPALVTWSIFIGDVGGGNLPPYPL